MSNFELVGVVTNIVTALAALGGVSIAGYGLSSWKAQAKWNSDTELSRRMLVLMFKHKDSIAQVRHPAIWSNETEEAVAGLELPKDEVRRRYLETSKVYDRRWALVAEIRSQIYPLLLEIEALWGRQARDLFIPIWNLENELRMAIEKYLRSMNPRLSSYAREASAKSIEKQRDIMYDSFDDAEDVFRKDYSVAMQAIENFLRSKLGQPR